MPEEFRFACDNCEFKTNDREKAKEHFIVKGHAVNGYNSNPVYDFEEEKNLIVKLAIDTFNVKTISEKSEEMLFYEEGVYRFGAEQKLKSFLELCVEKCSTQKVNELLNTIKRHTFIPRTIFDETNPHLVLQSCLYNLDPEKRGVEEFSPDFYSLNKIPITYQQTAQCPNFLRFINEILPKQDVKLVQEILGAILRKKYLTRKFAIFVGGPGTGKSTLLNCFIKLLSEENVSAVSMQRIGQGDKFTFGPIYRKMANICDDLPKDIVKSIGNLKKLTGRSLIQAERKFGNEFEFENYALMLFACNELPPVAEDDEAFWDRVILINFNNRFGGHQEKDVHLLEKITTPEELSGILNWGLEGLERLEQAGYSFSRTETIEKTRAEYKARSDPLDAFISSSVEETDDESDLISKDEFYEQLRSFSLKGNLPIPTKEYVGRHMAEKCNAKSDWAGEKTKRFRAWRRIKWKEVEPEAKKDELSGPLFPTFRKMNLDDKGLGGQCEYCNNGYAEFKDQEKRLACGKCANQ